jgi:translation initiation factor 2B subunit (eIF-2B alpha/beta/delta family)
VDEMLKIEVPVVASIDACIGELVPRADVVFVGADAVSSHGYVFCKVGTYPTALVAKRHNVPFYVAADTLKFDSSTLLGIPFRAEPLNRQEVLGDRYPLDVQVAGTLFDETPPDLITGIITEIGILPPTACATVMQQMKLSTRLSELIPSWAHGKL